MRQATQLIAKLRILPIFDASRVVLHQVRKLPREDGLAKPMQDKDLLLTERVWSGEFSVRMQIRTDSKLHPTRSMVESVPWYQSRGGLPRKTHV